MDFLHTNRLRLVDAVVFFFLVGTRVHLACASRTMFGCVCVCVFIWVFLSVFLVNITLEHVVVFSVFPPSMLEDDDDDDGVGIITTDQRKLADDDVNDNEDDVCITITAVANI